MNYYFKGDFPLQGKFLPLLRKEGLGAFKLVIFKLNNLKFENIIGTNRRLILNDKNNFNLTKRSRYLFTFKKTFEIIIDFLAILN